MEPEPSTQKDIDRIKAEIGRMPHEPLLPVEKKLLGWSLGLGIALLIVLAFLSRLFPVTA
jgi:hypothetical protein